MRPDPQHPVTLGWACNKGIATLDVHRDPDRLSYPLQRPGSFDPLSNMAYMTGIPVAVQPLGKA